MGAGSSCHPPVTEPAHMAGTLSVLTNEGAGPRGPVAITALIGGAGCKAV